MIDGYSFGSRHDDETRCPSGTELSANSTIHWSAECGLCQGGVQWAACTYAWEICAADSRVDDGTDSCDSAPCLNGGQCVDGTSTYTCTCASGWYGDNCDSDVRFVVERGPCTLQPKLYLLIVLRLLEDTVDRVGDYVRDAPALGPWRGRHAGSLEAGGAGGGKEFSRSSRRAAGRA
eukprot:SAG31_NODE_1376_length_8593_cov_23.146927_8_plen_176_part_01